jgi:hypothetical protein
LQRLKLKCDDPLSKFAFNFNLRRYSVEQSFIIPNVPDHKVDALLAGAYTPSLFSST